MDYQLIDKGLSVSIKFPDNTVGGPLTYRPAMEFVAQVAEEFKIIELPDLEPEKQVNFVQCLIRGGLLKTNTSLVSAAMFAYSYLAPYF